MTFRRVLVLACVSLLIGACSGPQTTTDDSGPSSADEETTSEASPRASVTQYETFDVSSYPVTPPNQNVEVSHQVPQQLMKGRADEGATQTVEGFRIQVYSAQDKEASQEFREKVRRWWEGAKDEAPSDLFREQTPILIEYSQPYYRVRIGAFSTREQAEEALDFVRKTYDGAFVVQSTVTVVQ